MNEVLGQQKRRQLQSMLDHGLVMLHLDPRVEGVSVPPQFRGDPVLRLNIAYGFNLPALDIDASGVYAMLSFSGRNFGCNLPWEAIFAMTAPHDGHEGMVWPESIPAELAPFFADLGMTAGAVPVSLQASHPEHPAEITPAVTAAPPETLTTPERPRPLFVVHEGGRSDDDDDPAGTGDGEDDGTPPKRPRLTVVKD
ncbi:MAG: hypothetical protein CVU56_09950 [Deltaproteobacteria bacterium HGW-Deltaproteobacteria-14]|jgi:stringent starvation protein B|nr:MAG: hypothetical protein CVU56_09950 [Deltaproteobacteria bacterium HGW-Deltaproteobacteria-14]